MDTMTKVAPAQSVRWIKGLKNFAWRWPRSTPLYLWLRAKTLGKRYVTPAGWLRFGHLRRLTPLSPCWGADRGQPIDRYYIENFLASRTEDIRGHVLEIGWNAYTTMYGGGKVTKSEVLHIAAGNPDATIIADLTSADHLPSDTFDCIILTQTLHFIYDVRAAVQTLYRILKPGGVLLVTGPGINKFSRVDMPDWADYWHFTTRCLERLLGEVFPAANIKIESYGNVLVALATLHGLAAEELSQVEMDYFDPDFEVLITARAVKPEAIS